MHYMGEQYCFKAMIWGTTNIWNEGMNCVFWPGMKNELQKTKECGMN